ncbi:MAG: hypothetical protein J7L66_04795 [Anaerolineaceae bacterium]|nr:hypothetical protein [Anaerolineaceae bacterium]
MSISRVEKWVLIIIAILMWVALALMAGGPIFSDEIMYLDLGLRNIAEPSYGNRYFHVYLQKLFISVFPTPLIGVRVFWGFLIALTVALIYLNTRLISRNSTVLHGLLAVAFFFSFNIIREYSGEPAVDITVMAMTTIYLTVYLWAVRKPEKEKTALFFLGLLAFLSFKTKETAIFINILLLGFLKGKLKRPSWIKNLLRFFTPFYIGFAVGIMVFILLDSIFLRRPFFAISPSTIRAIFTHYDFGRGFFFGPTSWYKVYLFDDLLLAFLLFIISGIQFQKVLDESVRVVWIYPLVYIAFISWNMLKITFGFIERFIFPALPVIAMLAPLAIRFEWPHKKREKIWFIGSLILTAVLILMMRLFWQNISKYFYLDYGRMLEAVYFPILISFLLATLIWETKLDWKRTIPQLFCIATLLFTPLAKNYKYFAVYPKVKERYEEIFYPFITYNDKLDISEGDQMFVSTDFKLSHNMLSTDPNDIIGMYNFFFDARISDKNVFMGYNREKMALFLQTRNFSHVLLTVNDVEWLEKIPEWETIQQKYDYVYIDGNESIVLLKQ